MPPPRQILPGQFYLLTRRCTQRQLLMRPDPETTNAFYYCLALAAQQYGVTVVYTLAESNHHHTVFFDPHGHCSTFVENFHKLFARSQNNLRGRCEHFWASGEPCITRLLDRTTVIKKIVYTATNPVKDCLVERVRHWPGPNAYASFKSGRAILATRPRHFFRERGPLPKSVMLEFQVPQELGRREEVVAEVAAGIERDENAFRLERQKTGAPVLGRRRVLKQSWKEAPTSSFPRRQLRPRFAGHTEVRVAALAMYRGFLWSYRCARKKWLAGVDALFPVGTYWLARFANVQVEKAEGVLPAPPLYAWTKPHPDVVVIS